MIEDEYLETALHFPDNFREAKNGLTHPEIKTGAQTGAQHDENSRQAIPDDALVNREEHYRLILESIHDGYFETALNGRITYLNSGLVRIFGGTSKADLLDANIAEFTDRKNARQLQEVAKRVFTTGESIPSFIYQTKRRNGDWYEADISLALMKDKAGRPIGYRGIIRDVTERSRAEKALRESEERFRTLADTASDAILTIDESGKIVFANSAIATVFGYSTEEVIGQNVLVLISEASRDKSRAYFEHYLNNGQRHISWPAFNLSGLHQDGHEIPLELSLVEFTRNCHRYFTCIARDITERRRSEVLLAGQVEIFEMIATGQSLLIVLNRIARLIEEAVRDPHCLIFLLNPEEQYLWPAATPNLPETFRQEVQKIRIGLHSGSCGAAVHLKYPVVSSDISTDPVWADYLEFAQRYGLQASWSTPIFNPGREVLGTICLFYDHTHQPRPYEKEVINVGTHLASIAIERFKSEEKLRKSEFRFRALTEKNPSGIAMVDAKGVFIYASPTSHQILGYAPDEIIGKTAQTRVHPDDWHILQESGAVLAGKPGNSNTTQYRVRHKNGHWLWVETTLTNLLDEPGVNAVVVNFSDITQRKLAENGLRTSEERYRSLVAALDEGIVLIDENSKLIAANSTAERILGLSEQQIQSRTLFDCEWDTVHEDGSPYDVNDYPAAITLRTGKPCSNAIMGVHKLDDGKLVWLSINTQPLIRESEKSPYAVVTSFTDITEQLRAQVELRESEENYRLLFEHSFAGIVRMTAKGVMIDCNDAIAKMFGYDSRQRLLENDNSRVFFDLAERKQLVDELIEHGSLRNREIRMKRLDGSTIWALVNASVLQSKGGADPVLEGVVLDITERKLTEQKLEQLYEQSRALSAKLETVREEERAHIAREIHDNLGQMMTGLKLDFSWLEKRLTRLKDEKLLNEVKPKFGEIAKLLEDTIQTVRNIASDLRPGVLDTLGLRAAIDWQVREFSLRTGVNCSTRLCQEPKDLMQERATALFRILQEILTNITRHAKASSVKVELTKTNEEMRLTVSDNGIGITEEQIRNPKSLGLLGMRERATMFGGNLAVINERKGGTTIRVRMPIKTKPASNLP
ncbi:MAG: PAS domain S-box protein [Acidobacteria bacterium]|nr:PAS domain S-box protein [Acidobacteriota bacterium]